MATGTIQKPPARYYKLWDNSASTSSFAAQDVSVDLSGYNKIKVVAKYGTSNVMQISTEVDVGAAGILEVIAGMSGSSPTINAREFSSTTSKVTFQENYRRAVTATGASTTNNNYIIPIYIYGIK